MWSDILDTGMSNIDTITTLIAFVEIGASIEKWGSGSLLGRNNIYIETYRTNRNLSNGQRWKRRACGVSSKENIR